MGGFREGVWEAPGRWRGRRCVEDRVVPAGAEARVEAGDAHGGGCEQTMQTNTMQTTKTNRRCRF